MIWASSDPAPLFSESAQSGKKMIYGSWVVSERFYRALLRYGTFDEYHFFVDSPHWPSIEKKMARFCPEPGRVKVRRILSLPAMLSQIEYAIFFIAGHFSLFEWAHLRSHFAKRCFPICGLAHSVSYGHYLQEVFFSNMAAPLQPFDSIICTTKGQQKAIENLYRLVGRTFRNEQGDFLRYRGRLDHLPLGIEAGEFRAMDRREARRRLQLPPDKVILLYFGRFSLFDKMDLHPVLAALAEIVKREDHVVLALAGKDAQGDYARTLRKTATEMGLRPFVRFFCNPSISQRSLLYAASDIFLSPSDNLQESFGLTLLEAMAFGLPVVASDWDGYRDIVVPNQTGFLVPTFWADCDREIALRSPLYRRWERDHLLLAQSVSVDIPQMIEALLLLIRQKALRLEFGARGRKRVLENFDWKVLIPRYEGLWRDLGSQSARKKWIPEKNRLFVPDYLRCFSHYPAVLLNRQDRISIRPEGLTIWKSRKMPDRPGPMEEVISIRLASLILMRLAQKGDCSVGEIERYGRQKMPGFSPSQVRYHIMWLLKKDLAGFLRKK